MPIDTARSGLAGGAAALLLLFASAVPISAQSVANLPAKAPASVGQAALTSPAPREPWGSSLRPTGPCCGAPRSAPVSFVQNPVGFADDPLAQPPPPEGFALPEGSVSAPGVVYEDLASATAWTGDLIDPGFGVPCFPGCDPFWFARAEAAYFQRKTDPLQIAPGTPRDEFDYELGGRITVGRYFDCVRGWEASYLGVLNYEQGLTRVDPTGAGALPTPFTDAPDGLGAAALFGGAVQQQLFYDSRLQSFEANLVENGWDLMTVLLGFRYVDLEEQFRFGALAPNGATAVLDIDTENHLFGVQAGGDLRYPVRWGGLVGTKLKLGGLVNPADTRLFVASTPTGALIDNTADDIGVSFLVEAGTFYQVNILPRVAARVGYEFWYLWGLALAPDQTDFVLGPASGSEMDVKGDLYFHGATAGVEARW